MNEGLTPDERRLGQRWSRRRSARSGPRITARERADRAAAATAGLLVSGIGGLIVHLIPDGAGFYAGAFWTYLGWVALLLMGTALGGDRA
jgi:hypothetical protein